MSDGRIQYRSGNEHNPSDPFGRVELTIEADGAATLEHVWRMGDGAWTGQVDPAAIERIRTALAESPFPDVPREPVAPGSNFRHIEVGSGDDAQYAMLTERQGRNLDGYREAIAVLEALAHHMSGGAYRPDLEAGESQVTDVREAPRG